MENNRAVKEGLAKRQYLAKPQRKRSKPGQQPSRQIAYMQSSRARKSLVLSRGLAREE